MLKSKPVVTCSFTRSEAFCAILVIGFRQANVSLLSSLSNVIVKPLSFVSPLHIFFVWASLFLFLSHAQILEWVAENQKESLLLKRKWLAIWRRSLPVRSATTRSHVMSKCTYIYLKINCLGKFSGFVFKSYRFNCIPPAGKETETPG